MVKPLIKRAFRALARFVSRRPLLVSIAARALVVMPPLKRHLRSLIAEPAMQAPRSEGSLSPEEARVLVDLRDALAGRRGVRE
jgi:hypothetical protein